MGEKIAAAGAAALVALLPLLGPGEPVTGEQDDETYRVTDLDSHLEMCQSDWIAHDDKAACYDAAYETWGE